MQEIHGEVDEEATKLFKLAVDTMNFYNNKVKTMEKTRGFIRDNMKEQALEMWDGQYVARRPIQLRVLDVNTVSIVTFF